MKKIYANGSDELEFFRELDKRHGETNKKVTETVSEITKGCCTKRAAAGFFRYDPSRENAFGALRGAHLKSSNLPIKNPPGEQRRGDFFSGFT